MMAFRQANSAGSISSSLNKSMTELSCARAAARAGARSGNWLPEKMVAEWSGRHHWMEHSRNSSAQLSSSSTAWLTTSVTRHVSRVMCHLVTGGQGGEGGEVLGPPDGHEEEPGRGLVHGLRRGSGGGSSLLPAPSAGLLRPGQLGRVRGSAGAAAAVWTQAASGGGWTSHSGAAYLGPRGRSCHCSSESSPCLCRDPGPGDWPRPPPRRPRDPPRLPRSARRRARPRRVRGRAGADLRPQRAAATWRPMVCRARRPPGRWRRLGAAGVRGGGRVWAGGSRGGGRGRAGRGGSGTRSAGREA